MRRMNIQFVSSSSRGCCRGCSSREFIKTLVEDTKAVVWVVDLVSYDQELTGYDDVDDDGVQQLTTMQESLRMFDGVVNSSFFVDCPFIILFTNVSAFKEKLARTPMSSRFPDYHHYYVQASSDDDDDDDDDDKEVNRASKYLLQRFSRLDSRNHDIHSYLFDAVDSVQLQRVLAAVEETLLAKAKMKTKTKTVRRCRARVARPTS
jgi:guanine nucleotide-binding protein G(i) subunit alpha